MKRNILANYAATGLIALSQILVIPAYLALLGADDWGRLSVVLAWSAALLIMEAGVSLSLSRALSFNIASSRLDMRGRIARIERVYWMTASALAILAAAAFSYPGASSPDGTLIFLGPQGTLCLALLLAAAQLLGAPYRGILIGIGRQVEFNLLTVAVLILRVTTAIAVAWLTRSVVAVTLCLATVTALEACARRVLVQRLLPGTLSAASSTATAPTTAQSAPVSFAAGALPLAVASMVGAMTSQLDRLALSTRLSAADMGAYAIAATLSLATIQLAHPLAQALVPRMPSMTRRLIGKVYLIFGVMFVAVWVAALSVGTTVIQHWVPTSGAPAMIFSLLLVHLAGSTINVLSVPLHTILLSRHDDRSILVVNIIAFAGQLLAVSLCYAAFGAYAGALSWVAANLLIFSGYSYSVLRKNRFA